MDDFQEKFNQSIDAYAKGNQYNLSPIPAHSHNGSDSLQVDIGNIARFPSTPSNGDTIVFSESMNQWLASGLSITKLTSNSGTSTDNSANNLDTVAITGLSDLDGILVYYNFSATAGGATNPRLYNDTDSVILSSLLNTNGVNNGASSGGVCVLRKDPGSTTVVAGLDTCMNGSVASGSNTQTTGSVTFRSSTITTLWTADWTLALRSSAGVSAGGTQYWEWAVYKISG